MGRRDPVGPPRMAYMIFMGLLAAVYFVVFLIVGIME